MVERVHGPDQDIAGFKFSNYRKHSEWPPHDLTDYEQIIRVAEKVDAKTGKNFQRTVLLHDDITNICSIDSNGYLSIGDVLVDNKVPFLNDAELESVLLHEKAHYLYGDADLSGIARFCKDYHIPPFPSQRYGANPDQSAWEFLASLHSSGRDFWIDQMRTSRERAATVERVYNYFNRNPSFAEAADATMEKMVEALAAGNDGLQSHFCAIPQGLMKLAYVYSPYSDSTVNRRLASQSVSEFFEGIDAQRILINGRINEILHAVKLLSYAQESRADCFQAMYADDPFALFTFFAKSVASAPNSQLYATLDRRS